MYNSLQQKMDPIEQKYVIGLCIQQSYDKIHYGLIPDVTFQCDENQKLIEFIDDISNDNCWAILSFTPSNQLFIIHNALPTSKSRPFVDARNVYHFLTDIIHLINIGRKLIFVYNYGQKTYTLKKKDEFSITKDSNVSEVTIEVNSTVRLMAIADGCYPTIENFPRCDELIYTHENYHASELFKKITQSYLGDKILAVMINYTSNIPMCIFHNTIQLSLSSNPRPEVYTPESFMIYQQQPLEFIKTYICDAYYSDSDLIVYTQLAGTNGYRMLKIHPISKIDRENMIFSAKLYRTMKIE